MSVVEVPVAGTDETDLPLQEFIDDTQADMDALIAIDRSSPASSE
jgi:hypothetical protein